MAKPANFKFDLGDEVSWKQNGVGPLMHRGIIQTRIQAEKENSYSVLEFGGYTIPIREASLKLIRGCVCRCRFDLGDVVSAPWLRERINCRVISRTERDNKKPCYDVQEIIFFPHTAVRSLHGIEEDELFLIRKAGENEMKGE